MNLIELIIILTISHVIYSFFHHPTEYDFYYTIVIKKGYVEGQMTMKVCTAIELVENQYYLAPTICFDNPTMNMDVKIGVIKKSPLKFNNMVYQSFILRMENDEIEGEIVPKVFVILERSQEYDWTINDNVVNSSGKLMKKRENFKHKLKDVLLPGFPFEEDLPPRILLTIPNSNLTINCFTIGYGTFKFGNEENLDNSENLDNFENLDLKLINIPQHRPESTTANHQFFYEEIWFDLPPGIEEVQDIGSPMICKIIKTKLIVIIGIFTGGNSTTRPTQDFYRSFKGLFNYITVWSLGTNVSVTGNPADWTLWTIPPHQEPKSKGFINNSNFYVIFALNFLFFIVWNV